MARESITLVYITTVPISLLELVDGQTTYIMNKGIEVHGISSAGPLLDDFGTFYNVPIHEVSMTRFISPLRDFVSLLKLWHQLRLIKPDIVVSQTPKAGLLGTLAAYLAGTKVRVYVLLGLRYQTTSGLTRRILVLMERLSCLFSHRVLCLSQSIYELALAEKLCPSSKASTCHHGSSRGVDASSRFSPALLDETTVAELREQNGIPQNSTVVGFVGRLVKDKGLIELITAWGALENRYKDIYLLIIGGFEEQDPVPAAIREQMEQSPNIKLAGFVPNAHLPAYYNLMDVFVLPSYREGFGQVLLEANAMCVPVVATRIEGCVDAVVDGETGTLVEVKNANALERAISNYIERPDLRKKHGLAGRERVLRDFKPEDIWQAYYDEYMELLKKFRTNI